MAEQRRQAAARPRAEEETTAAARPAEDETTTDMDADAALAWALQDQFDAESRESGAWAHDDASSSAPISATAAPPAAVPASSEQAQLAEDVQHDADFALALQLQAEYDHHVHEARRASNLRASSNPHAKGEPEPAAAQRPRPSLSRRLIQKERFLRPVTVAQRHTVDAVADQLYGVLAVDDDEDDAEAIASTGLGAPSHAGTPISPLCLSLSASYQALPTLLRTDWAWTRRRPIGLDAHGRAGRPRRHPDQARYPPHRTAQRAACGKGMRPVNDSHSGGLSRKALISGPALFSPFFLRV